MSHPLRFEELWDSASKQPKGPAFDPAKLQGVPEGARRYLQHSIPIGESLRSAVRLRMHGEIKLKDWYPFSAEQAIDWSRGMIWQATVRVHGLPICGGDSYLDGEGAMRWKLLGILPVVSATGIDITRSAAGRVNIESIWLPSVLCRDGISWTASDSSHLHARFSAHNEIAEVEYTVDENGGLQSVCMPRWGNPEGEEFHYVSCGGLVEEEGAFSGYTIPTRMRLGWHFGTPKFDTEGEFFWVVIDDAIYG